VKVLYVMGHGWSGSTILGNVLGELEGFAHVGELRTIWDDGLLGEAVCGCGRLVRDCELWSEVTSRALGRGLAPEQVAGWHREASRVRHTFRLLRMERASPSGWPPLEAYLPVAARLYSALSAATGGRVVVDSSKRAGDAALLLLVPRVEASFVHLVRDPRAVAYSWRKRDAPGHGAVTTARDWSAFNLLDEAVRRKAGPHRSLRVRYEDFVARPRTTVEAVLGMLGEPVRALPFADEHTVVLGSNHTVLGNPVRFEAGRVELRDDETWRTQLPGADRLAVTALTLPLLVRYGYPVVRPQSLKPT
jgi:hypothetical protein